MKKFSSILFMLFTFCFAQESLLVQKGQERFWSPYSGLSIEENIQKSWIAKLSINGLPRQYVTFLGVLHDSENYGLDDIQVMTFDTKEYAKVEDVLYVFGADVVPVFGKNDIKAFFKEVEAIEFQKKHGGEILDYQTLLSTMEKVKKSEIAYQQNHKKKYLYPMGKKVLSQMCDEEPTLDEFLDIAELKAYLKATCKSMKEKHLHALGLYLWDVRREGGIGAALERVVVREDEKCPVCGMFTYKYPRWAAQIYYKNDDLPDRRYSFDGVKDMMKFYFDPMRWGNYPNSEQNNISKILVTDYYTQNALQAKQAFYVIGSDTYGPMGHELIPFDTKEAAERFKKDHDGREILTFETIQESLVYELDNPNFR